MGPDRPRPRMPIRIRQNDANTTGSVKSAYCANVDILAEKIHVWCRLSTTRAVRLPSAGTPATAETTPTARMLAAAREPKSVWTPATAETPPTARMLAAAGRLHLYGRLQEPGCEQQQGLRSVYEAESTHNRWSCILCAWRSWRCCLSNAVENYLFTKRSIFWSNWRKILHGVCNTGSDVIR